MLGEILFPETDNDGEETDEGMEGNQPLPADIELSTLQPDTQKLEEEEEGSFSCNYCSEHYTSQSAFAKHIREHLFPVYNYSEGPPRRGRRPVPLKKTESYRGSGSRGRGRGRGRPAKSRGRGRPPKLARTDFQEDIDDLTGLKSDEFIPGGKDGFIDLLSGESPSPVKRGRGRPRKNTSNPLGYMVLEEEDSTVENMENVLSTDKLVKDETLEPPFSDPSGPRRSSRAIKGFSKYLRLPGEEVSDEEVGTDGLSQEEEELKPRKRYGVAMAASLRKAAMDDLTSPAVKKRKRNKSNIGSVNSSSAVDRTEKLSEGNGPVTTLNCETSPVKVVVTKMETSTILEKELEVNALDELLQEKCEVEQPSDELQKNIEQSPLTGESEASVTIEVKFFTFIHSYIHLNVIMEIGYK